MGLLFSKAAAKVHKEGQAWNPLGALPHEPSAEPSEAAAMMGSQGLPTAMIPSSTVRGVPSDKNEEQQDYTALIKAGLDQLRNSAK